MEYCTVRMKCRRSGNSKALDNPAASSTHGKIFKGVVRWFIRLVIGIRVYTVDDRVSVNEIFALPVKADLFKICYVFK